MEITQSRVHLITNSRRLKAMGSVTVDGVLELCDFKVIQEGNGLRVAFPSREMTDKCPDCFLSNSVQANFCSHCGKELSPNRARLTKNGTPRTHTQIIRTLTLATEEAVKQAIMSAFQRTITQEHSVPQGYHEPSCGAGIVDR